jgi:hypothetical protein
MQLCVSLYDRLSAITFVCKASLLRQIYECVHVPIGNDLFFSALGSFCIQQVSAGWPCCLCHISRLKISIWGKGQGMR